jgi:hypothetical protein
MTTTKAKPMALAAKANVKALNPRSPDTKYVGNEPEWHIQPVSNRTSSLSNAFGWYNYFYGKKDAKDFIGAYLDANNRSKEAKKIRALPDNQIRLTTGWLCRMSTMGLELSEHEQAKLDTFIQEALVEDKADEPVAVVETKVSGPSIQDRLREKASEAAGELEGLFDDFVAAGAKMSAQFQPITIIRGHNVAPQLISYIQQIWKRHLTELEAAVAGKDAQLVEGYGYLTKTQLKQLVKFAEQVITDCNNYVQIKKVERKPRAKKAVSPEKVTAKFKYLKTFPDLKLVSEPAVKLVDATEAWLYDTVKRKLIHVVGDAHRGNFTVKSSAVIGFDTGASSQKTLRKPAETIKALMSAGKPATRKIFKELTTTETQWNGRGNENLIILKVW